MTTKNHTEETHLKLLDTYEQPEEFRRVLEEALALAEKRGAEGEKEETMRQIRQKIQDISLVKDERDKSGKEVLLEVNRVVSPILQALNPTEI